MPRFSFFIFHFSFFIAFSVALAEPPPPQVVFTYPAGGARGATVEVVVTGNNLQTTTHARCTNGAEARMIGATTMPAIRQRNSQSMTANSAVRVAVKIPTDAKCGLADLRLIGPGGISNRGIFEIGQLPEHNEVEPNSAINQAERLPGLPITVNGQLMEGDRDLFRFAAKAGQTIVCRVQARALVPFIADGVPGWNDVCMTLYGPDGREVVTVDDTGSDPDPVLIHEVKRDGDYTLELRDILLRGRGDFVYRVSIGQLPHITRVFPLGGPAGKLTRVQLWGVNLPANAIDITSDETPGKTFLNVPGIPSTNDFAFAAGEYPERNEDEPNNSYTKAPPVNWPIVINGRIDRPGDVDCYRIAVAQPTRMLMEVHARRLGSPLDSRLTLLAPTTQPGGFKQIAENDDFADAEEGMLAHQADSRLIQSLTRGTYVLKVADVAGKGGESYGYRLTIAPARPDFSLLVMPDNLRAARGDNAIVSVKAIRKDGFNEPIAIDVEGLPPAAKACPAVIPAGADRTALTISIPPSIPAGVIAPRIVGTALPAGAGRGAKPLVREASPAEECMQAFSYKHILPTRELTLAVVDSAPFALTLVDAPAKPIEMKVGDKVEFKIRAVRPPGEPAVIWLRSVGRIPALSVRTGAIQADQSETTLTISLSRRLPPGTLLNVIVTGSTRMGKESFTRTLPAVPIIVAGPSRPAGPVRQLVRPNRLPATQPK